MALIFHVFVFIIDSYIINLLIREDFFIRMEVYFHEGPSWKQNKYGTPILTKAQ